MTSTEYTRMKIVNSLIESIEEQKVLPWNSPYLFKRGRPSNLTTGTVYRGMNALILTMTIQMQGWDSAKFITKSAIKKLGCKIKKGASAVPVYYTGKAYRLDGKNVTPSKYKKLSDEDKEKCTMYYYLKTYWVYNVTETTVDWQSKVEPVKEFTDIEKIENCEKLVKRYKGRPEIVNERDSVAFYRPIDDIVNMPKRKYMKSNEAYYSTLFHELTHSTGHESRLNRELNSQKLDKTSYSKEELIAELGALFMCSEAGIDKAVTDNSAAYLNSWLKVLKSDTNFIWDAAVKAQKAADFMLSGKAAADKVAA